MKSRVDVLDRAILKCLQEDARMPCSEIARRLGCMSARAVRNRLHRLIRQDLIAISAGAIPKGLGYVISADIFIEIEPGMIRQVADRLVSLEEVIYVALSTGDADISATVVAVDMRHLQTFISDKLHSIPGVRKTRTQMLTEVLKQSYDWSFPLQVPEVSRV